MKKNYFSILFAALMLFVAMPAKAQVESMTDLYGKYKFTATITPTEAGKAHADLWKSECEVIITKGANGAVGTVKGLLGEGANQTIANFDATNKKFEVVNPNPNYGLLSSSLYIGVADMSLDNLQLYTMEYHFNPETKEITIPDFSICQFSWPAPTYDMVGEVLAEVKNVKMELLEAEEIIIPEIEGEWSFKPYSLGYVRNDTTFAYEFKMNLTAKDDTKKLYDATFNFEGFDEFTLEATFNGVDLIIPFDSTYLDAENNIRLGIKATKLEQTHVKKGQLSFSYSKSTMMWQGDYIVVRKDSVISEEINGTVVERDTAMTLQQITYGWIERKDPNAFDWSGNYTVNVKDIECFNDTVKAPETFEMEVVASAGGYTVTKFAGYSSEYYPSIELTPGEDGKSATLDLAGYSGFVLLNYFGEVKVGEETYYEYHILTDGNGKSTSLDLTLNEDGTISIDDFMVTHMLYSYSADAISTPMAMMSGVTASKVVFEWTGDYTLTAEKVDVYYQGEDVAFPETFDVTISYFDGSAYGMESVYYISSFLNKNIEQMPIDFSLAEDGWSAEMLVGGLCGSIVTGETYYKIYDMNATDTPITVTANVDGSISIPSFFIKVLNYSTNEEQAGAFYQNVTLTKKATEDSAVDSIFAEKPVVEGIFDFMGRKLDAITAPGLYIVNGKKVLVK